MRLYCHCVALIEGAVAVELGLGEVDVLVGAQHRHIKTGALHLHQLVNQHVAGRAELAGKTQPAAQQERLAVGAAVGELGEVQVDAVYAGKLQRAGVFGVGDFKDFSFACARLVCVSSYQFHSHSFCPGWPQASWVSLA